MTFEFEWDLLRPKVSNLNFINISIGHDNLIRFTSLDFQAIACMHLELQLWVTPPHKRKKTCKLIIQKQNLSVSNPNPNKHWLLFLIQTLK